MMSKNTTEELIKKYNEETCTPQEKAIVETWYLKYLEASHQSPTEEKIIDVNKRMRIAVNKHTLIPAIYYKLFVRIAVAASIIICIGFGAHYFMQSKPDMQPVIAKTLVGDALPGSNKAMLTLSNGNLIILTNAQNGVLGQQGTIRINKTADGEIIYTKNSGGDAAINETSITYNTISTPRGGQWKLTLCDGTQVWLNAGSTIIYPTEFNGNERKVEITGEAYFEVAHIKAKPFRVLCGTQTVEVLGTHFNINAYKDEPVIKTTLLEGSIKIIKADNVQVIKPGEQAWTEVINNKISIRSALDSKTETAWKDGYFRFDNAGLAAVMRQFSRWYDVDIIYSGDVSQHEFNGKISREANLSKVLKILALSGVHFKIKGKSLIVLP